MLPRGLWSYEIQNACHSERSEESAFIRIGKQILHCVQNDNYQAALTDGNPAKAIASSC